MSEELPPVHCAVLRVLALRAGRTHLVDLVVVLRALGYTTSEVSTAVRELVSRGLARGLSLQRLNFELTEQGWAVVRTK